MNRTRVEQLWHWGRVLQDSIQFKRWARRAGAKALDVKVRSDVPVRVFQNVFAEECWILENSVLNPQSNRLTVGVAYLLKHHFKEVAPFLMDEALKGYDYVYLE